MSEPSLEKYGLGIDDAMLEVRSWQTDSTVPEHAEYLSDTRPILLLLHYFGGSSLEWQWLAPRLSASCYSSIAFDARGHGGSRIIDPLGMAGYSVEEMAGDARAVAANRWCESRAGGWILVGHSMGGKVALHLAAQQPEGLRALILIAPSPPSPQPMSDQERQEDIDRYGDSEAAAKIAKKIAVAPLTDEQQTIFVEDNLRTSKSAWLAWDERGSREDISAVMPSVTVPTLLIYGSDDPVISQQTYETEVADRLPNLTRKEIVPGAGHLVTMTHSGQVGKIMREWLATLPQP